jgi:NTE family protein
MAKRKQTDKVALVLSGGGARGAYEAGVIYYLRTQLPEELRGSALFNVYCGTSVGAINTAFMASMAHDPIYQGAQLRTLWQNLVDEDVYYADVRALSGFLVRTGFFMAANFFGLENLVGRRHRSARTPFPFKSVLDTTPFVYFLRRSIPWNQIHSNIERGVVDAVTVTATHMMSGQPTLFMEKRLDVHYREGGPLPQLCQLSPKHILASAAIPLVFPIIRINRQFYGDGSLRQNTPMSPAIHLGARRILVVSTHYTKTVEEVSPTQVARYEAEPAVGDVLGTILDALFMDKLDYDLEQMKRINYIINDFEEIYGKDALAAVNRNRRKKDYGDKEVHPINPIAPFVINPSEDIGMIASEHFRRLLSRREKLTPMQKFFARIMEGTPDTQNDLVSFLLFHRDYLESLLQLGYEDARANHDHLVRFFAGGAP